MDASPQGDIHSAHRAKHSTCLTCGLMALPRERERERERDKERERTGGGGERERGRGRETEREREVETSRSYDQCVLTSFHSPVQNIL